MSGLNEAQTAAVLHDKGPLVVFAGAGSGKTRIITHRIAHMIEHGVRPWEILAVTFTNKAAKEMKERVERLSYEGRRTQIATFHSVCARWLREFAEEIGFTNDFTIYDDSDSNSVLKKMIKERMPNVELAPYLADFKTFLHLAKINGLLPNEIHAKAESFGIDIPEGGAELYLKYQEYLANCNAMDFGDLIVNMLLLLRRNERVRNILQKRYQYVMVDEFQDTNRSQLELVTTLSKLHNNLFVVGDDDQSIYSWRGASPRNLIDFERLFPGAKRITMAQNYRSARNIVAAASAVVKNNITRAAKELFSEIEPGPPILLREESDGEMEAWYLVDRIKQELLHYHYSDFAIFYRTNSQSRLIEDALRRENIPYRVFGAVKFYDRLEVKDILAFVRLMVNENDDVSLRRIINVPARGIGAKAVDQVAAYAMQLETPMLVAMRRMVADNVARLGPKLSIFLTLFEALKEQVLRAKLDDVIPLLVDGLDYKAYLQKKHSDQFQDKMENLHELSGALADFAMRQPDAKLADWLQTITLVRDEETDEAGEDGVSLMTLHTSKGLEFKRVFIVGVEDGLIPHRNNMTERVLLEEERRLLYVGMTRAREKLTLLCASERMFFNQHMANQPSQFLREIPNELLEVEGFETTSQQAQGAVYEDDIVYDYNDRGQRLVEGATVRHPSYGRGVIETFEYNFGKQKAVVKFGEFGRRKVPLHHLQLL
jgi:DNA helicase-2/ATP-dependent DNA helicase PcrA